MEKLVILSVSQADGWYRVKGQKNRHVVEKIAVWAAICREDSQTGARSDYMTVGMIPEDLGCNGLPFDELVADVAGYVHQNDFENNDFRPEAFKRLVWD